MTRYNGWTALYLLLAVFLFGLADILIRHWSPTVIEYPQVPGTCTTNEQEPGW